MIMKFGQTGGQETFHYTVLIHTIPASGKRVSIHCLHFSCGDIWTSISLSLIFF